MSNRNFSYDRVLATPSAGFDGMDVAAAAPTLSTHQGLTSPALGTLFGGSLSTVTSEVTRGEKGDEGVRLFHVKRAAELCGGVIKGTGVSGMDRFCCKVANECTTKSHKIESNKVELQDNALHVRVKKGGTKDMCRASPSLKLNLLPLDEGLERVM
jgi:hypothetical protein